MPVQIIFAGKAHPRDNPGKELIRQIIHISRRSEFRHRMVFIEDYDMNVARYLVQGVDVWLNTPLRPMEASGTSGMKVVVNGGLNVSVLDGWWNEGYSSDVGWAIGAGERYQDLDYQNEVESRALYDLLEKEIVPMFYDRGPDGLPREWIKRMKLAAKELAPRFSSNRMVREYAERFYLPAASRWEELTRNNLTLAEELSKWKRWLRERFDQICIEDVHDNINGVSHVGQTVRIEATVALGEINPKDVSVQLYYGRLNADDHLQESQVVEMTPLDTPDEHGRVRYAVEVSCQRSGLAGYTIRVLPRHHALHDSRDMGLIKWA